MRLNPAKYIFGVSLGSFLDFMIFHYGERIKVTSMPNFRIFKTLVEAIYENIFHTSMLILMKSDYHLKDMLTC